MNKIYFTSILLFAGCVSSPQVDDEPITSEQYDPDQVSKRAKELGLRPVDYLHRVNNERLIFYQAYDPNWDDPTINPIFLTKAEAEEYAKRNNMGGLVAGDNSHSYEVREVNYRYEVRIGFSDYTYSNGTWKDTIFTSSSLKESEKYLNEHKTPMQILVIYDLKTGLIVNE